jgi:hypothetical protein
VAVNVSSETATISHQIGFSADDIADAPLVDPTAERVYAFIVDDKNGDAGVFQFMDPFSANSSGVEETVGTGNTNTPEGGFWPAPSTISTTPP